LLSPNPTIPLGGYKLSKNPSGATAVPSRHWFLHWVRLSKKKCLSLLIFVLYETSGIDYFIMRNYQGEIIFAFPLNGDSFSISNIQK
jgi:hypothetical protein